MSGPSDPFAYHTPKARSSGSAARLPILGGQLAPAGDDQTPLLFEEMSLASPREIGHPRAGMSCATRRPPVRDTSGASPDS